MKAKPVLAGLFVVVILLSLGGGSTLAQTLTNSEKTTAYIKDVSITGVSGSIPVQGYLTNTTGLPLNGEYSLTMALYNSQSGGNPLCQDSKGVQITEGKFNTTLDSCTQDVIDGRQLYFGIKVGSDVEMTPRQPVYPVPYAWSLKPGATVSNDNLGHGVEVRSAGAGSESAALWAENTNSAGTALWAQNSSNASTLVLKNQEDGPLILAYNGVESEDQFRVSKDGSIASHADTYIFIPGSAFVKAQTSDGTRWNMMGDGSAQIWSGSPLSNKVIFYPITLPAKLYGQQVEVKALTIYYRCLDGARGWISGTQLQLGTLSDSLSYLGNDDSDYRSNSWNSYTVSVIGENLLDETRGILGLHLHLNFTDDVNYVQIGGIRLQLGTYRTE